jgi:hypothetical protein
MRAEVCTIYSFGVGVPNTSSIDLNLSIDANIEIDLGIGDLLTIDVSIFLVIYISTHYRETD